MTIAFVCLCAHTAELYSYSLYSARSQPRLISPRLKAGVLRRIRIIRSPYTTLNVALSFFNTARQSRIASHPILLVAPSV